MPATASWDNDLMSIATITVDAELKERLANLARETGQSVDEFVEAILRRIASADVRFDSGVRVLPRRPGAPTLSVEDIDRLAEGVIRIAVWARLCLSPPFEKRGNLN